MMKKVVGLLALLGLWMLVAGRTSEATPVYTSSNDRPVYSPPNNDASTYIVLVDKSLETVDEASAWSSYTQMLQSTGDASSAAVPLHVYRSVCSGFSAQLTQQGVAALREMDGVLGVYPDTTYSLHTTYTPKYLGLNSMRGLLPEAHSGDDVIIGMLDTGVWPERPSFSDEGLGPVPARWRGICQLGTDFTASNCNRKIIGARYYVAGYAAALKNITGQPFNETLEPLSPRDFQGHGSHTTSTAAGSPARNVSLFGSARGVARGMAPKARIAVYKVCWLQGCASSDVLAAMDQAVIDGVDLLSLSLGSDTPAPYFEDPIAIGAFGAMIKGIFVSCSAGNDGPDFETVSNFAPWITTVAASTVDRIFPAKVELGDGQVVTGQSLYQLGGHHSATLITGADAATSNVTSAALCMPGSLNPALVTGKIVVCNRGVNPRVEKSFVVATAGGAGMILANLPTDGEVVFPDPHFLPASHVGAKAASVIFEYMNRTNPTAKFKFKSMELKVRPAPVMAFFSSRGPNPVTPQILKPDITGPGVFILAAWTGVTGGEASPSALPFDTREVDYNIISGTSMSCPHITGVAALLRAAHPQWSPAAIKSAMMTTATVLDNTGHVITDLALDPNANTTEANPFVFGSGQVRPEKAVDPGLVYDLQPLDYVNFLCALGYSPAALNNLVGDSAFTCTVAAPVLRVEDFNYPSFAAVFEERPSETPISMNMTRTVTNVGYGYGGSCTTYKASILAPKGIQVSVYPDVLTFCARYQKLSFTVQVTTVNTPNPALANFTVTDFAYLQWRDHGHHVVQSPISVSVQK
jgi:subtilisin family serine protease